MSKRATLAAHVPVLLPQVLEVLAPSPRQTIVDCTVGLGGHSAAILRRLVGDSPEKSGRLIGIDFDPANLAAARPRLPGPRHAAARRANVARRGRLRIQNPRA